MSARRAFTHRAALALSAALAMSPAEALANGAPAVGAEDHPGTAVITVSKAADGLGAIVELRPIARPTKVRALGTSALAHLPLAGRVTSRFGMRAHPVLGGYRAHRGVDLAAPAGSPVLAPADGIVAFADWRGGYGLMVAVEHGGGVQTRFAHLSRTMVRAGEWVSKGQLVGLVGSTGRSTGAHLHYEVRQNGAAIDPLAGR